MPDYRAQAMTMKTKQEQIDEIMDWFDFERVADFMKKVDWKWAPGASMTFGSPTVQELRSEARRMLNHLYRATCVEISCGGLVARLARDGYLSLTFEVTSWECGFAEEDES